MAVTNVYGTGANSTAGANTIVHYYDRAGVVAATEDNIYGQFADRKHQPQKYGKTFKISKFVHIYDRLLTSDDFDKYGYLTSRSYDEVSDGLFATDGSGAKLTEGAGATNKRSIKKITMDTSFSSYGEMIDYTDEVELFSEDYIQVRYRQELGHLANRRTEDLIQLDYLGTTNVMYAGTATSMEELGDGISNDGKEDDVFRINYDLVRQASRKLVRNRAVKTTKIVTGSTKVDTRTVNRAYYGIIGAEVKYDLETITDKVGDLAFIPINKYAAATNLAEGEVGATHDVRFIESEAQVVYRGAGAPVNPNYEGDLSYTADEASLYIFNTTSSPVSIAGEINDNPYGTAIAAGEWVKADNATDATTLASVTGLARAIGNFDVFPIIFPTEGAYATVGLRGRGKIQFTSQSPEKTELANPYKTKGFFAYRFWFAGIILQEERLLKVLVLAGE